MKRKDLIKIIDQEGWYLKSYGRSHDMDADSDVQDQIPRHKEIKELLAHKIIKYIKGQKLN